VLSNYWCFEVGFGLDLGFDLGFDFGFEFSLDLSVLSETILSGFKQSSDRISMPRKPINPFIIPQLEEIPRCIYRQPIPGVPVIAACE
jgi:hypothetical protein